MLKGKDFSGKPYWQNTYKRPDGSLVQGTLIPNRPAAEMAAESSASGEYVETLYLEDMGDSYAGHCLGRII